MRVLVACEFSGRVREAFRNRGHDAVSCDLRDTWIPGPHIRGDVRTILNDGWDMMIAFPPCTYLANSGNRPLDARSDARAERRRDAIEFVRELYDAPISRVCVENPIGCLTAEWRWYDQWLQPYFFGHPVQKTTCLWLRNLPRLRHTQVVKPKRQLYRVERAAHRRAMTFPGVADAMAEQWGELDESLDGLAQRKVRTV